MKTKEEIEQLAEQDFNDRQECGHYELADLKSIDYYYDGFTNGYTHCQQDNKDKKYTKEQIINAYWSAYNEGKYRGDKTAEEYYKETFIT